jgi:hypothetical protein
LLKQLADENNFGGLKLIAGLFKMSGRNTPEIEATLKRHKLEYIPEAHCYLKFNSTVLDFTKPHSDPRGFTGDLIGEREISTGQITDYKVAFHKSYLATWLTNNTQIKLEPDELWEIREQCIRDLTEKQGPVRPE